MLHCWKGQCEIICGINSIETRRWKIKTQTIKTLRRKTNAIKPMNLKKSFTKSVDQKPFQGIVVYKVIKNICFWLISRH